MRKMLVIAIAAALMVLSGISGAVAGSLVTSRDIKNNTVQSVDVRNGTLQPRDLRPAFRDRLFWTNALAAENEGRLDYVDEELDRLYELNAEQARQIEALQDAARPKH